MCTGTWTLLPHPTPPHPQKGACVCWTARQMIRFAVPVCAQEHEGFYPTPPHPTGNWSWKSSACACWRARKMIRLLCLCVHRNMNVITPPHPTHPQRALCVQLSHFCVRKWVRIQWKPVCATESVLCAQVSRLPPFIKCNKTLTLKVSWLSLHQVQQDINPKGVVALLTSSATRLKP